MIKEPPPELCLGCGDDLEHGEPIGTSPRHICRWATPSYRPASPGPDAP